MKTGSRDAMLMLCLPAVVTGMVYVWAYGRAATTRYKGAAEQARKAEEDAPPAATLAAARQNAEALARQVATEREKASELACVQAAMGTRSSVAGQRSKALSRISKLLEEHRIGLLSSTRLDTAAPKGVEQLSRKVSAGPPEFWRIEAVGSYGAMVEALKALGGAPEFIVPVGIEMQPVSGDGGAPVQKWSLTVWM